MHKYRSVEYARVATVRSCFTHCFRSRKFRQTLLGSHAQITDQERLKHFSTLKQVERKHLVQKTMASRRQQIDNGASLEDILEDWPFLSQYDGLILEYKILSGKKDTSAWVKKLKRLKNLPDSN